MSEATQQTDVSEESEGGILGAGLDDAVGFEGENQGADQAAFVAETQADAQEFNPAEFDWLSGDIDQVPEQYRPLQKVARQQQSILNRTNMDMRNQEKRMRETEEKYLRIIENAPQQENETPSTENGSILHTLGITPDSDGYDAALAVESIAQAIVKPYLERLTGVESGVGQIMDSYQNTQARQQAAQQTAIQSEIDEATSTHGDAIWKHQDDIAYFRGKQNPDTGQPYTVLQAFERVTQFNGAPATSSTQPNRTGPGPRSVPSNNVPSGPMDSSQVLDGLKNLGFE